MVFLSFAKPLHIFGYTSEQSALFYFHQCAHYYSYKNMCVCVKSLQPCLTLATPWTVCSPPGSSVHGILQARILEQVAMPSSRGSSQPRDLIHISYIFCIGKRILYTSATWEAPYKIQKHIKNSVKTIRIYSLYYTIMSRKTQENTSLFL